MYKKYILPTILVLILGGAAAVVSMPKPTTSKPVSPLPVASISATLAPTETATPSASSISVTMCHDSILPTASCIPSATKSAVRHIKTGRF